MSTIEYCSKRMYYNTQQLYSLRLLGFLLISFSIILLALSLTLLESMYSNDILTITLILGIIISITSLLAGIMSLMSDRICFLITSKVCNVITLLSSLLYLVADGLLLNNCYDYSYNIIDRNYCNNLTASFAFTFLIFIVSSIVTFVIFCFISIEESSNQPLALDPSRSVNRII